MKSLIESFTTQLREAVAIAKNFTPKSNTNNIQNVIISGLGGSGIGGTIVSELVAYDSHVPIVVNKNYFLPAFANEQTLLIISSYSGNTEETIAALKEGIDKQCQIVCITSGGEIAEIAKANNLGLIVIPGGMPPRACLAYSFTQLIYVLVAFNIINNSFTTLIEKGITLIEQEADNIKQIAKALAQKILNKTLVIYVANGYEGVAIRFRQQVNENSKILAWHHVLPEMNHNELVGWRDKHPELAVVFLRNDTDYTRTQNRIEFSKNVISKYTDNITELYSKGNTDLEKTLYWIHLVDWVSLYLSELKNIDANEIEVINTLKATLSTVK